MVTLESVGCGFEEGTVYPMFSDGTFDMDNGTPMCEIFEDDDFWCKISDEDELIVKTLV